MLRDRIVWQRSRVWLLLAGTLVLVLGLLYGQPRWTTPHQLLALLPPAAGQATPSKQSAQLQTLVHTSLRLQPANAVMAPSAAQPSSWRRVRQAQWWLKVVMA